MSERRQRWVVDWLPAVVWAAVIYGLSEQSRVPGRSMVPLPDWFGHLVLFGVLGVLLGWGARRWSGWGRWAVPVGLGVAYGVVDEWHQSFTPGRDPSVGDVMVDAVGVVLGVLVLSYGLARGLGPKP